MLSHNDEIDSKCDEDESENKFDSDGDQSRLDFFFHDTPPSPGDHHGDVQDDCDDDDDSGERIGTRERPSQGTTIW